LALINSAEFAEGLEILSCNGRAHPFERESLVLSARRNCVTEPDDFGTSNLC